MWQILLNGPGYLNTWYELPEGETVLGRGDDNQIVLSGELVSRRHARLVVEGGELRVADDGSRNGTLVNGMLISTPVSLAPGDLVEIGENRVTIQAAQRIPRADTTVVLRQDVDGAPAIARLERARGIRAEDALRASPEVSSLLLLYQVSERLASAPTLQDFLEDMAQLVLELARARAVVVLLGADADSMKPAAVRHRGGSLGDGEVPLSDGIVQECVRGRVALCVENALLDDRFAARESVVHYGVEQVICVPLRLGDEVAGVLYLNRDGDDVSPQRLVEAVTAVAHLAASGLERQRLRQKAADEARVRRSLERFLAPDVVDQVVSDLGTSGGPQMKEHEATVIFADISGFTALTQRLPPRKVVALLDEFYKRMTTAVFAHGGTVDKFIGDAVMAIFGAPYSRIDDASRALRAALAMQRGFEELLAGWPEAAPCKLKIGMNSGRVLAGTVGSEERLEYTAVGDPVNVAARLVGEAAPGQIVVSRETLDLVGPGFQVVALGERSLRGREGPVAIFELLAEARR